MSQKYFTLVFPFSENSDDGKRRVLLGLKKRGTGKGLWNGFGGKLERNESMEVCAIRELQEECGLQATSLEYVGVLYMDCTIDGGNKTEIFVYRADSYSGEVTESDEMAPQWFNVDNIPYSEMYEEAQLWCPILLDKNRPRFTASFAFDGDDLISHTITSGSSEEETMQGVLEKAVNAVNF